MAISYYPNRVRTFPTHRNLLDDVDAEHVNSIQEELRAVMLALGTSPQVYNDISTDNVTTTAIPNDQGESTDDDVNFTSTQRFYDPLIKPVDHGSVGQRLDDIERGKQHHAFHLRAANIDVAHRFISTTRPRGVRFPKPARDKDPYDMFNGFGVTLRKSGFWIFSSSALYVTLGDTPASNAGTYQASIDTDGYYYDGMVRVAFNGQSVAPTLSPQLVGYYPRGTRISFRTSHDTGRNQRLRSAYLSGVLIQETS